MKHAMKWSLILSLVGGLSSCMLPETGRNDAAQYPIEYGKAANAPQEVAKTKAAKVAASKSSAPEVAQKSAPGPKRAAAPQLPVIQ